MSASLIGHSRSCRRSARLERETPITSATVFIGRRPSAATAAAAVVSCSRASLRITRSPASPAAARARDERPRRRRTAEQRDELAPAHSITSSARPRSGSGRPFVRRHETHAVSSAYWGNPARRARNAAGGVCRHHFEPGALNRRPTGRGTPLRCRSARYV
jgi:hypothetical protein